VIVSGVIALDAVADDVLDLPQERREGRFAKIVNRVFGRDALVGRQLDRSLDYRPITGLFALTILGLVGFLYMHTRRSSRRKKIRASCSR